MGRVALTRLLFNSCLFSTVQCCDVMCTEYVNLKNLRKKMFNVYVWELLGLRARLSLSLLVWVSIVHTLL